MRSEERGTGSADAILNELAGEKVLAALGLESIHAVVVKYDLVARPTVTKYMTVAEAFTESEVLELGTDKSYALVRYAKAIGDKKRAAMFLRSDLKIAGITLGEHSAIALNAARSLAQARLRDRADAEDGTAQDADKAVRALGTKLRRNGAPTAKLQRKRRGGRFVVRVELDPHEAMELAKRFVGASR